MVKRVRPSKKKSYLEEFNEKVNRGLCALDATLPWFDILVFLKYFSCSVCIYLIADSSLTALACIVAYRIFRDMEVPVKPARGKNKSPGIPIFPPNPDFRITLSMVCEWVVRFTFEFCSLVLISFISYLGLALLAFVVACYASVLEAGTSSLDDRFVLEEMDENTLLLLLHRLGHRVPKWLSTPDHHRVEWLNKIILKLWPHIGHYIEDVIEYTIKNNPNSEGKFKIKNLYCGDIAPRVSSVKVREREGQMFIDVSITYASDFSACVERLPGIEFEVDHIKVQADIQIELKDFVSYKPFVEKLVVHMDKPPIINAKFKKIAKTIEAFETIKNGFLEYVQNAVKGKFPLTIPDDENPIENLNNPQSESNKSTSSKSKNYSLWDIVSSRPLLDESKPSQIVSFLQERNSSRKRSPDPAADDKNVSGVNDSSLKTKDSQKKSCSPKETDEDNWMISSSFTEISRSSKSQGVASLMTSSSQSQNMSVDWYISSPSNQSLLSASNASQLSISSAGNESSDWLSSESGVTIGSPSSESLVSLSVPDSEILKMNSDAVLDQDIQTSLKFQDIQDPLKFQDPEKHSVVENVPEILVTDDIVYDDRLSTENDLGIIGHAHTSPGSLDPHSAEIKTDISTSSGVLRDELRAAIARDVEASRGAFLDRILTESEIDDEYTRKQEIIEPDMSVSRESLTRIKDTDQGHGCIELTTRYQAPNIFIVTVHQVRNLPKKLSRIPNPYVKLYMQNQQLKPITDVTTEILDNTRNPVFEKSFEFHLEQPLSQYTLRVSAKTKHKMAHKIGEVVLCFARYTSSQVVKERNWYNLSDPKKDYVLCWVGYRDPADADHTQIDRVEYNDEFNEQLL